MDCKDLVIDALSRVEEDMRRALDGISAEQLVYRPAEHANSIAWLGWHLTRVMDDHVSEIAGRGQAWVEEGWHARFGRAADARETGWGHTPEQVAAVRPEAGLLLEYFAAVYRRCVEYLSSASCEDMDRIIDASYDPPVSVGVRLTSVANDATQHVGQMLYVRGLLEGGRWLPY